MTSQSTRPRWPQGLTFSAAPISGCWFLRTYSWCLSDLQSRWDATHPRPRSTHLIQWLSDPHRSPPSREEALSSSFFRSNDHGYGRSLVHSRSFFNLPRRKQTSHNIHNSTFPTQFIHPSVSLSPPSPAVHYLHLLSLTCASDWRTREGSRSS